MISIFVNFTILILKKLLRIGSAFPPPQLSRATNCRRGGSGVKVGGIELEKQVEGHNSIFEKRDQERALNELNPAILYLRASFQKTLPHMEVARIGWELLSPPCGLLNLVNN